MYKNKIAICFTVLFLAVISLPSILTVIDDSIDISMFYSLADEEESEKNIDIDEVLLSDLNVNEADLASHDVENNLEYYYKTYPKPHLNLISPPPEHYIL